MRLRFLFAPVALALLAVPAQATKSNPGYARDTAPELRSGDYYLLCDDQNDCAIVGVAKSARNSARYRALILLDRSSDLEALWQVRLVLLDGVEAVSDSASLPQQVRAYVKKPANRRPPVVIDLTESNDAVHPLPHDAGARLIEMLALETKAELRDQGLAFASLPRGNLRKLLNRAEREQRTHIATIDPEETEDALRLPRFNHDVWPAAHFVPQSKPELVEPCGKYSASRSRTWLLTQGSRLWLVDCPQEMRVFRQFAGKDPERLNLTDLEGRLYQPRSIGFDPDNGLMTMVVRSKGREDCGHRVTWGWTGINDFQLLSATSMPMCRDIPAEYWPTIWGASGWRIVGRMPPRALPGDCPPEPDNSKNEGDLR